jgi:ABC-2 type transport system permease protein
MPAVFKAGLMMLTQQLSVQLGYRLAFAQVAVFEALGLAGTLFYWRAAAVAGNSAGTLSGYSVASIVVYFIVASSHMILEESGISRTLSMDIRTGKLAASLVRPFPFLIQPVAQGLAYSLSRFFMIGPVLLAIFAGVPQLRAFFVDVAQRDGTWTWIGAYLLALMLGLACNLVVRLILGVLAFDMTQTWGPELLFMSIFFALSGAVYPVDLLPAGLVEALSWTPLFYMQGLPNLVAIGRIAGDPLVAYLGRGAMVLSVTTVLLVIMWRRGIRKFEAIGI